MPDGGKGLFQWVRLLLDKRSAEEVKKESQKALREGTDPKKPTENLSRIEKAKQRLVKVAQRLALVLAAAFSVRHVIRFAQELEESRRILVRMTGASGAALKSLQADARAVFAQVPESIAEVSTAIGSLNTLLGLTGEHLQRTTKAALDFARANSVDVASATELIGQLINRFNLEATDAVGFMDRLTLAGQRTGASVTDLAGNLLQAGPALATFGFSIDQQIALMAELERRGISASEVTNRLSLSLGRFAEQGARDGAEAWNMLVASIQDAENEFEAIEIATEAFGRRGASMALDIRAGALEIDGLTEALDGADGTLRRTEESSRTAGQEFKTMANALKADLMPAVEATTRLVQRVGTALMWLTRAVILGTSRAVGFLVLGFQMMHEEFLEFRIAVNRFFRRDTADLEESLKRLQAQMEGTRQAIRDLTIQTKEAAEEQDHLSDSFRRTQQAAGGNERGIRSLSAALKDQIELLRAGHEVRVLTAAEMLQAVLLERQVAAALRAGNVPLEERIALQRQLLALQGVTGGAPGTTRPQLSVGGGRDVPGAGRIITPEHMLESQRRFIDLMAEEWVDHNRVIVDASQIAAMGVASAWEDAFSALRMEGSALGNFFEALGRGMGASLLGGFAQMASVKIAENIAGAWTERAKGMAAAASPLTAWMAPGHFAAAQTHMLAAAKWAVLGGAAGAGQSAIGGGGRASQAGGLPRGATDPTGRMVDGFGRQGPDITIWVDGVDPSNPRHQAAVGNASREYSERHGGRITVKSGSPS